LDTEKNLHLQEFYNNKKILITGGLGFIGSNLAEKLIDYQAKVIMVDAILPLYGGNFFNIENIKDKITFIKGDIRNKKLISKLINGINIIFNLAGQVSYIDSLNIPYEDLDINCRGHLNILEACRKINKDVKIIFSSSRLVYGKITSLPVNEEQPTKPLSLYAIHKLAVERYLKVYHDSFSIKYVVFRITNPYGIRQQMKHSKYSILGWFLRLAMEGKTIKIFGDGKQLRDYIYIDDIINAFLLAGANEKADDLTFNLGYGESISFGDMIKTIIKIVGNGKYEYVEWPNNYERVETGDFIVDIEKAKNILSWEPTTKIEDGIKKTFDFYKKNKSHYWH
jgi:nucleoside-diphosphate-sugar epimerase